MLKIRFRWLVACALTGCTMGGEASDGNGPAPHDAGLQRDSGAGGRGAGDANRASATPPVIAGTWAQILFYASINDIPTVGQTEGSTTTIQRVTIEQSGTALTMQVEPCAIEIDNGSPLVDTIVPQAFLRSLGITPRTGTLVALGGEWRYVQDESLQLRGVRLDDPDNELLPTEADDPRIWDQDGDSRPGVTVRVTGITDGEVYVIQRDRHELDGAVAGDRIDGLADWNNEQVVLGSDNPILDMQTSSVKNPEPQRSYFWSVRIDEGKGCLAVVAELEQLFGHHVF
jgi:hypothetical protein